MLKAQDSIATNIYIFIRIVSKWNDLPTDIVEAESLHHFKHKQEDARRGERGTCCCKYELTVC